MFFTQNEDDGIVTVSSTWVHLKKKEIYKHNLIRTFLLKYVFPYNEIREFNGLCNYLHVVSYTFYFVTENKVA